MTWRCIVQEHLRRMLSHVAEKDFVGRMLEAAGMGNLLIVRTGYNSSNVGALKQSHLDPEINYLLEDELLCAAVAADHVHVVAFLIASGVRVNPLFLTPQDSWHPSPLQCSASASALRSARVLLEHGASVNTRMRQSSSTALSAAVVERSIGSTETDASFEDRCLAMVDLLLQSGADVTVITCADLSKATVLHKAVFNGYEKIVRLLLDRGCHPDCGREEVPMTPLMVAFQERKPRIIRLLLQKGADLGATTRRHYLGPELLPDYLREKWGGFNFDVLHFAIVGTWHEVFSEPETLEQILDILDEHQWSYEAPRGSISYLFFVLQLLQLQRDLCFFSFNRSQPLRVLEMLLTRGVDPNEAIDRGWTALMEACSYLSPSVAQLLLSNGATVDQTSLDGDSALKCLYYRRLGADDLQAFLDVLIRYGCQML